MEARAMWQAQRTQQQENYMFSLNKPSALQTTQATGLHSRGKSHLLQAKRDNEFLFERQSDCDGGDGRRKEINRPIPIDF